MLADLERPDLAQRFLEAYADGQDAWNFRTAVTLLKLVGADYPNTF
ncbi:hypothetical protein Rvan_0437 [Rhodomicrobium vannielii ATCC 17100]|uniref:Uncharacterized protein n=1 Tax=Rhodomicrobium vannielii (strain ATCC 17100 / DSM 162 / LMG 4299 / NCIMB 10020 / ATH 3.1.1) TaxID=648757 RepID=E3I894_RHOVT|nr:hypothetical protein Rvan_0437 [Rhodomicrobium vannielii ATCC 17100]